MPRVSLTAVNGVCGVHARFAGLPGRVAVLVGALRLSSWCDGAAQSSSYDQVGLIYNWYLLTDVVAWPQLLFAAVVPSLAVPGLCCFLPVNSLCNERKCL